MINTSRKEKYFLILHKPRIENVLQSECGTNHRTIAHYVGVFLSNTENWIYTQIASLNRFAPIVLTGDTINADVFPVSKLFSLNKNLTSPLLFYNRIIKRIYRRYPYFIKALRAENAVLIHAHFGMAGYWILGEKIRLNLPLVTSFYGMDASAIPRMPVWQKRYKELFAKGDLFLAEGPCMKQKLVSLGCPGNKIAVHHLGIDLSAHKYSVHRRIYNGTVRLFLAARFHEKKGILYALRAFAEAKKQRPNIEMVLLGDGPDKEKIVNCIRELDIGSSVKMPGYRPHADFLEWLEKCHIYIQPSVIAGDGDTEGGAPVTLISAQAAGLPVVATSHADIPEVVVHDKTGFLSPEKDVACLTRNLLFLLDHPERCEEMGAAGREHVEKNFNKDIQAVVLENIYDSLI
jgi:colanic acid/amylovoran biosynthesis glycosyltransferase